MLQLCLIILFLLTPEKNYQ